MSEMKNGRKEWMGIASGYKVTSEQEKVNSTLCSKINYTKYFKISREALNSLTTSNKYLRQWVCQPRVHHYTMYVHIE